VRWWRLGVGVAGALLLGYGSLRLLTGTTVADLRSLAIWLVGAVVIHDGLVSPAVLGAGRALGRIPPRPRRFAQAGLVVSGMLVVVAAPLIYRQGTQTPSKALLLRDYTENLALLLLLVAGVSTGGYLWSLSRDQPGQATRIPSADELGPR